MPVIPAVFRRKKQRGLFRYHDGTKERVADPFRIWQQLMTHEKFNLETMVGLASQGQEPEASTTLAALCEIFDVHPWDEATQTGLTGWEILSLISQFTNFLMALKKNTSPGQTPWLLSALPPSTSQEPPSETESVSSGCGKTSDESKPDEPMG